MIRWGLIGCGKVVQNKSGAAFRDVPYSKVAAVMGRDLEKAKNTAEKLQASEWCDTVEELLSKEIDAVYIATPPGLHYEQALACLKAGKPVYLEKPMARNYTEAKALTEAFAKAGVPLYIAHYRRAQQRFLKIRELLNEGTIGKIEDVEFSIKRSFSQKDLEHGWLYDTAMSGGGKFYDIAPHAVDMINFLFGNIVKTEGKAQDLGMGCPLENYVEMSFETEKGIRAAGTFHGLSEERCDRMYVKGTKGTMEFSVHGKSDIVLKDLQDNVLKRYAIPEPKIVEEPMIQSVVEDLLGIGVCESRAEDVLVTYEVIDQILDSFYGGRSDEFWKYPERCGR